MLAVTIDPADGSADFDFAGTGCEILGNLNAPRAVTYSAIIYCMRCMLGFDACLFWVGPNRAVYHLTREFALFCSELPRTFHGYCAHTRTSCANRENVLTMNLCRLLNNGCPQLMHTFVVAHSVAYL